jgi:hypothetical protein
MVSIDLSGLAANRRCKMGRPPSCNCSCGNGGGGGGGGGDPPDFDAPFFSLVFVDSASRAYNTIRMDWDDRPMGDGDGLFEPDLKYLREKEQSIGRMNSAVIQTQHPKDHDNYGFVDYNDLKAESYNSDGPRGLPEEVLYLGECVARHIARPDDHPGYDEYWRGKTRADGFYLATSFDERQMMTHITNNLIRDKYQCIGVYISLNFSWAGDVHTPSLKELGLTRRVFVEHLLDEWYWNIGTSESSHAKYTRYIVDSNGDPWPLPSCTSGKLGLGLAGGCVREISEDEQPKTYSPPITRDGYDYPGYWNGDSEYMDRWLRHWANGGAMVHHDPDGCTDTTCCDSKSGWPEICAVTSDVTETPATVNFNISWVLSGTSTNRGFTVTLEDQFGNVTNAEFKAEILEAFAVWKAALEDMCSWLTVTFTDLGDETRKYNSEGIPVQVYAGRWSEGLTDSYPILEEPFSDANLGDIRIGMHYIDNVLENPEQNPAGAIAHAWSPRGDGKLGVRGNEGGDIHFDLNDAWRKDNESVAGARSVKWTAAHAIGTILGLPQIYLPNTIMYSVNWSDKALGEFDVTFPDGVIGSYYDYLYLKTTYCIAGA